MSHKVESRPSKCPFFLPLRIKHEVGNHELRKKKKKVKEKNKQKNKKQNETTITTITTISKNTAPMEYEVIHATTQVYMGLL